MKKLILAVVAAMAGSEANACNYGVQAIAVPPFVQAYAAPAIIAQPYFVQPYAAPAIVQPAVIQKVGVPRRQVVRSRTVIRTR